MLTLLEDVFVDWPYVTKKSLNDSAMLLSSEIILSLIRISLTRVL